MVFVAFQRGNVLQPDEGPRVGNAPQVLDANFLGTPFGYKQVGLESNVSSNIIYIYMQVTSNRVQHAYGI